jgi:hypothetical protein
VGCEQLEMVVVGAGVASACVVGMESMAFMWVVRADGWGDGSDRRGPLASERGRANGWAALTGRARCAERIGRTQGKGAPTGWPSGQRERGSGCASARDRMEWRRQAGPTA